MILIHDLLSLCGGASLGEIGICQICLSVPDIHQRLRPVPDKKIFFFIKISVLILFETGIFGPFCNIFPDRS